MEKLFRTINFIVIYLGVVKPKCIARATHPSNKKLELYMDLYTIAGASSFRFQLYSTKPVIYQAWFTSFKAEAMCITKNKHPRRVAQ